MLNFSASFPTPLPPQGTQGVQTTPLLSHFLPAPPWLLPTDHSSFRKHAPAVVWGLPLAVSTGKRLLQHPERHLCASFSDLSLHRAVFDPFHLTPGQHFALSCLYSHRGTPSTTDSALRWGSWSWLEPTQASPHREACSPTANTQAFKPIQWVKDRRWEAIKEARVSPEKESLKLEVKYWYMRSY